MGALVAQWFERIASISKVYDEVGGSIPPWGKCIFFFSC